MAAAANAFEVRLVLALVFVGAFVRWSARGVDAIGPLSDDEWKRDMLLLRRRTVGGTCGVDADAVVVVVVAADGRRARCNSIIDWIGGVVCLTA